MDHEQKIKNSAINKIWNLGTIYMTNFKLQSVDRNVGSWAVGSWAERKIWFRQRPFESVTEPSESLDGTC
jgi:hypothetical protein